MTDRLEEKNDLFSSVIEAFFSVGNLLVRRWFGLIFGECFGLGRRLIDHRDDYDLEMN